MPAEFVVADLIRGILARVAEPVSRLDMFWPQGTALAIYVDRFLVVVSKFKQCGPVQLHKQVGRLDAGRLVETAKRNPVLSDALVL
jgi:hypothetical protein